MDHYDGSRRAELNEQLFHVLRHLHNTVAAALSLVDHTRVFYRKYYSSTQQIPDYQQQITTRFEEHGLTQFVICLRQFCQHYRNVMIASTIHVDNARGPLTHW